MERKGFAYLSGFIISSVMKFAVFLERPKNLSR